MKDMPHAPQNIAEMRRTWSWQGAIVAAAIAVVISVAATGCQGRAGAPCQTQSDCRAGFVCDKPTLDADAGPRLLAYGICQPARLGLGGICLNSAECQDGLRCSNTVGIFTADGRHGTCELIPLSELDLASGDLHSGD